jgi:hypothetical protein
MILIGELAHVNSYLSDYPGCILFVNSGNGFQ